MRPTCRSTRAGRSSASPSGTPCRPHGGGVRDVRCRPVCLRTKHRAQRSHRPLGSVALAATLTVIYVADSLAGAAPPSVRAICIVALAAGVLFPPGRGWSIAIAGPCARESVTFRWRMKDDALTARSPCRRRCRIARADRGPRRGCAGPVTLSPAERAALVKEIEKDRADTEDWLKSDITSYLATVDRRDFEQRTTLTVGPRARQRRPYRRPRVHPSPFAGHRRGRRFPGRGRGQRRALHRNKQDIRSAVVNPSAVAVGRFQLRLSHQRYPASSCSIRRARVSRNTRGCRTSRPISPCALSCR